MKVYQLESSVDAEQTIGVVNTADIDRFDAPYAKSLADGWQPVRMKLKNTELPLTDTPGFIPGRPFFSARAVDALRPLLVGQVEVLPVDCKGGEFNFINVTRVIDAVDRGKTEYRRYDDGTIGPGIVRYVFRSEMLEDAVIFKIPDFKFSPVFVTTPFVQMVKANGLTGFALPERWPGHDEGKLLFPVPPFQT